MPDVAFDAVGPSSAGASANGNDTSPTTLDWSHTVGAGSDQLLIVGVSLGAAFTTDTAWVSSATYNGVAMASLGLVHANNANAGCLQLFGLVAPPQGAHDVVITTTGTVNFNSSQIGQSASFNDVDQADPLGAVVTAFGDSNAAAAGPVASQAGDMVAAFACGGSGFSGQTGTLRARTNFKTNSGAGNQEMQTYAGAESVSPAFTLASDFWAVAAVNIRAASGGTAVTVDGTGAAQLGGVATVAAGRRIVHGSVSAGLGAMATAAGSRRTVHAAAAAALGSLEGTATGARTVHGAAASVLGGIDTAGDALRTVHGDVDAPLGGLATTATGEATGSGEGIVTADLGRLASVATGHRTVHGSAAAPLGGLATVVDGKHTVHGRGVAGLAGLTSDSTATRTVHGTAANPLGRLLTRVSITAGQIHGNATALLGQLATAITGHRTIHGAVNAPLGTLTSAVVINQIEPGHITTSDMPPNITVTITTSRIEVSP